MELIEKRGAFFRYKGESLGQGRENAKQFLHQHPAMALEIENLIPRGAWAPGDSRAGHRIPGLTCAFHPEVRR